MTPSEILSRFTSAELSEQMAYQSIKPFEADRADFLMAQLTALFVASKKTKKGRSPSASDFTPWVKPRRQTTEEMLQLLKAALR